MLTRKIVDVFFKNTEILYNHRPDWIQNHMTNCNLELDIYIPEYNIAFEFNGPLHEKEDQKFRDKIKQERCDKWGILLVVINLHPSDIFRWQDAIFDHCGVFINHRVLDYALQQQIAKYKTWRLKKPNKTPKKKRIIVRTPKKWLQMDVKRNTEPLASYLGSH